MVTCTFFAMLQIIQNQTKGLVIRLYANMLSKKCIHSPINWPIRKIGVTNLNSSGKFFTI
ncbi:hypothetical protein J31TS3_26020 [Paenibacillus lactis]|nr:hypothetical protein J31TS3_26020 [Paenibacillus lactis]